MTRRIALLAAVSLFPAILIAGDKIDYRNPPPGTFRDDWMLVELSGSKAGYSHSTLSRDGDVITSRTLMSMTINRFDQSIDVSVLNTIRETIDGRPLSFDSTVKMGTIDMATRGRIADGKVHLESTQFGKTTRQKVPFPEGGMMLWGNYLESLKHGFEEGTQYEISVFDPSMSTNDTIKALVTVGPKEMILVDGKQVEATRVTSVMKLAAGEFPSIGYVDETGHIVRGEVALAGISMVMTQTDRTTALKEFTPPEFFVDTLVRVDKPINRDTANRVQYTLRVKGDDQHIPPLPTTTMQTPGARDKKSAKLTVTRIDHDALLNAKPINAGNAPPELAEYLCATPTLNINDDAIVNMARKAGGDETNPYKLADKLRVFVSSAITNKNLNVGFATASEVCRKREGDCTEHGVLLAALGRVHHLPSRVVVGLAYLPNFGGRKDVFGFHMWTQFHIGGQWVDFDAALEESDCNPGRIVLATSSLKDFGVGEVAFAIVDIITGLQIDIDKIEHR